MKRSTLRIVIIILTLITAFIHLYLGLLFLAEGLMGALFYLNAIGYLVLLWLLIRPPAFLEGRRALVHYVFMAYTALTILAYIVLHGELTDPLGIGDKIVEILLIITLWLHLRANE